MTRTDVATVGYSTILLWSSRSNTSVADLCVTNVTSLHFMRRGVCNRPSGGCRDEESLISQSLVNPADPRPCRLQCGKQGGDTHGYRTGDAAPRARDDCASCCFDRDRYLERCLGRRRNAAAVTAATCRDDASVPVSGPERRSPSRRRRCPASARGSAVSSAWSPCLSARRPAAPCR